MRPKDRKLGQRLRRKLIDFDRKKQPLPGIRDAARREAFVEQVLESIRRVNFIAVIRTEELSNRRTNPNDEMFDPLKAAILHQRRDERDEAFWLVFLSVHFGKHRKGGWRYLREIYGRFGDGRRWDWASTSASPSAFRAWLDANQKKLKRKGAPGGFGNHRKYQSLDARSPTGTGAAVETYVRWVDPPRTHEELVREAVERAGGDPHKTFGYLYKTMRSVATFGRLARFDYLTMLGKLGLAPVAPGSTYMEGSTGPVKGARLLFGDRKKIASPADLDKRLQELDVFLDVGMQVLEDALCNWQKNPQRFKQFRG